MTVSTLNVYKAKFPPGKLALAGVEISRVDFFAQCFGCNDMVAYCRDHATIHADSIRGTKLQLPPTIIAAVDTVDAVVHLKKLINTNPAFDHDALYNLYTLITECFQKMSIERLSSYKRERPALQKTIPYWTPTLKNQLQKHAPLFKEDSRYKYHLQQLRERTMRQLLTDLSIADKAVGTSAEQAIAERLYLRIA